VVGIGLGVLAAVQRGKLTDQLVSGISYLGIAVPDFFWAIVLVLIFGSYMKLLPTGGYAPISDGFLPWASHLVLPDRSGNNRIDSFKNITSGPGHLQLIFFVPGIDETLRVTGIGKLSADPALLATMEEFGKPPRAALTITVSEAYFHCGKALMRSKLWARDVQVEREVMPSVATIIHDQTGLGAPEAQADIVARYKTQL